MSERFPSSHGRVEQPARETPKTSEERIVEAAKVVAELKLRRLDLPFDVQQKLDALAVILSAPSGAPTTVEKEPEAPKRVRKPTLQPKPVEEEPRTKQELEAKGRALLRWAATLPGEKGEPSPYVAYSEAASYLARSGNEALAKAVVDQNVKDPQARHSYYVTLARASRKNNALTQELLKGAAQQWIKGVPEQKNRALLEIISAYADIGDFATAERLTRTFSRETIERSRYNEGTRRYEDVPEDVTQERRDDGLTYIGEQMAAHGEIEGALKIADRLRDDWDHDRVIEAVAEAYRKAKDYRAAANALDRRRGSPDSIDDTAPEYDPGTGWRPIQEDCRRALHEGRDITDLLEDFKVAVEDPYQQRSRKWAYNALIETMAEDNRYDEALKLAKEKYPGAQDAIVPVLARHGAEYLRKAAEK